MARSTRPCPPPLGQHLLASLRAVLGYSNGHRQAGRVAVAVIVDGTAVTLTVTEDVPWWADQAAADGTELALLRKRAGQLGGTVTARPRRTG